MATKQQSWLVNPSSNDAASPDASPAVSMSAFSLPRYLSHSSFHQVTKVTIVSVAPELANTELGYIHQGLQCLGTRMLQVLAGVKVEPSSNILPLKLNVVNDLSSDMPTHMLGVYSRHVPAAAKCRVTLFPIHNIFLATHCTNLPILPPSNVTRPDAARATISLPMVPLCIPVPDVFPQLSMFLYMKRIDHLLTSLLPCPIPHALYHDDPKNERVLALLQRFSDRLTTIYSTYTLLTHTMLVNGLWRNVCALGINDEKLWRARFNAAWEVLMNVLSPPASGSVDPDSDVGLSIRHLCYYASPPHVAHPGT